MRTVQGQRGWEGRWTGAVLLDGKLLPLALDAQADSVLLRFGTGAWLPFERPSLSVYDELRGSVTTAVPGLTLAASGPTRLDFVLKREGQLLRGYVLPREHPAQPAWSGERGADVYCRVADRHSANSPVGRSRHTSKLPS